MTVTIDKLKFLIVSILLMTNILGFSQNSNFPERSYNKEDFPCLDNNIYTQLDFMLGHWEITTKDLLVGKIMLEKDAKACMVKEKFTVRNGHSGAGIDYYDQEARVWRRILIVSNGTIETFEGEINGEKFIWNGREVRKDGSIVLERVEIWKEGSKIVNNIFQSKDNGSTWEQTGAEVRIPTSHTN